MQDSGRERVWVGDNCDTSASGGVRGSVRVEKMADDRRESSVTMGGKEGRGGMQTSRGARHGRLVGNEGRGRVDSAEQNQTKEIPQQYVKI
ncbi:hypothetical protein BC834DRAFT_112549 [Gloeopeniophorella convolvens]|nr:hypothetical protein BC834DRAFT_112549 [Gloeopeniophorella convolvens]